MKKSILMSFILVCCLLLPGFNVRAEDGLKWAYVDLQKAVRSVEQGKKAYEELKAMKEVRQKELEKDEADLRKEMETLKKQKDVLSEDALQRKNRDFTRRQMEFQQKLENFEMELMKTQNEFAQGILKDMETIIVELGKENSFEFILDEGSSRLVYAKKQNDITDEVIIRYNKRFGKKLKK